MDVHTHSPRVRRAALGAAAFAVAALAVLGLPRPASAHTIQNSGQFKLAIGWAHEPTYTGVENAVQVIITGPDGKPFTDFPSSGSGLKVVVMFGKPGGGTLPASPALDLDPSLDPDTGLGMPGETLAAIVPTQAGDYTFHITGQLGSQNVDITVTSGDQTFDTVKDPSAVEFPAKNPPINDVVSAAQRAQSRADAAALAASHASDAAQSADRTASHATLVGIIALVVGAVLGGGAMALVMARRRPSGGA